MFHNFPPSFGSACNHFVRADGDKEKEPRENKTVNSICVMNFSASRKRLLNATISITPDANPIEKLTILSLTLLSKRTNKPPVANPAMRLSRNG